MNEAEARGILGIGATASLEDAKRSHRDRVKILHPDRAGSRPEDIERATQATARVNQAWAILQDLSARGLLGSFVDESPGFEAKGDTFRVRPRSPHSRECILCGSYPATQVEFRSVQTFLIWAQTRHMEGAFCRSCGLGVFRDSQSQNLIRGWWGIGVFFMVAYLFSNLSARKRVVGQPWPAYRDIAVITPIDMPLPAGKPVTRRVSVLVTNFLVLVIATGGIWGFADSGSSRPAASGGSSSSVDTLNDLRATVVGRINEQDIFPARKACYTSVVEGLNDTQLSSLRFEVSGAGPVWDNVIRPACEGPFANECFSERDGYIRSAPCSDPKATWRFVTEVSTGLPCPNGTAPFGSAADPTVWCLART